MQVGDVVVIKEESRIKGVEYGVGIVVSTEDYPEEGFVSHKVVWSGPDTDWSFHNPQELELISENK